MNSLNTARDAARGLGLHRGDMRWIKVAGMFDQSKDNVTRLFQKAQNGSGVPN